MALVKATTLERSRLLYDHIYNPPLQTLFHIFHREIFHQGENKSRFASYLRDSLVRANQIPPSYYVYVSTCQLLNNSLEIQYSLSEISRNPLLFGGALSIEEHVLGCMHDRLDNELAQKQENSQPPLLLFFH